MRVLLTGGTGYIGSHVALCLLAAGHDVTLLDNFSNSHPDVVDRLVAVTGRRPRLVEGDVRDGPLLRSVFADTAFDVVLHLAGSKSIDESCRNPLLYYDNNLGSALGLLAAMAETPCRSLLFSSSATVYGDPETVPVTEKAPCRPQTPYGWSKLFIETILRDTHRADPNWRIAVLRYFNPVGAHESGLLGENPRDTPGNLMPYLALVASGQRERLLIFGDDYPTPDGTGVRDFIHIMDLAEGHLAAIRYLATTPGVQTFNLGTGTGYSVREVVQAFSETIGRAIPCTVVARRKGDVAACYADPGLANRVMGWSAQRGLHAMCADTWRWQGGAARPGNRP